MGQGWRRGGGGFRGLREFEFKAEPSKAKSAASEYGIASSFDRNRAWRVSICTGAPRS